MILKVGDVISMEVDVKVISTFAHEDRIFYIVKPLKSYTDSIWLITADGESIGNLNPELISKASKALERTKA